MNIRAGGKYIIACLLGLFFGAILKFIFLDVTMPRSVGLSAMEFHLKGKSADLEDIINEKVYKKFADSAHCIFFSLADEKKVVLLIDEKASPLHLRFSFTRTVRRLLKENGCAPHNRPEFFSLMVDPPCWFIPETGTSWDSLAPLEDGFLYEPPLQSSTEE